MQDYLREIEGTLARKKERKSTLLYQLSKHNAEQERLLRLGVRSLPTNPHDVSDVKVVKYVLFKLNRDLADKIARLRDPQLLSIETHGEVVVRSKNDEVNHLIARKNPWERRLAALTGKGHKMTSSRKLYFGCAKELPEAQVDMDKGVNGYTVDALDEPESESESESSDSQSSQGLSSYSSNAYLKQLASCESEIFLSEVEKKAELRLRLDYEENNGGMCLKRGREGNSVYFVDVDLPSEDEFRRGLLDAKREMLQKRLQALKK
ncbi:pre-mRNA-splicing factor ISY1 [Trypanosoma rangeli]|uniref:Pre-mRNA-splicing factor ISY1 n=1 Tax=Trypanosoma rangeli TaxID=5698 RepID=A0A3R7KL93_TRYRA|nr:pre-mRNA-splicing factor ISY1 [Trypanosoma rangeli]RNF08702.1 pre-mRNA-splicing factor ISY1 [Trypanosoma rangeli]|eukprot:RNF08702.1 pre-mRNA-splicing factor ISY1 [Trypanosoma rangeli]